jgi:hypothetical protein
LSASSRHATRSSRFWSSSTRRTAPTATTAAACRRRSAYPRRQRL